MAESKDPVNSLTIEIEASSTTAEEKLQGMISALGSLRTAASDGAGLSAVNSQLVQFRDVLAGLREHLDTLDAVTSRIQSIAQSAGAFNAVSQATEQAGASAQTASTDYSMFSQAIETLKNEFGSLHAEASKIDSSLEQVNSSVQELRSALSSLSAQQASDSVSQLKNSTDSVLSSIEELKNQVSGISTTLTDFSNAFRDATNAAKETEKQTKKTKQANEQLAGSILKSIRNFSIFSLSMIKIVKMASSWVTSINTYVENVNLFQVSMGEFYDEAYDYAQLVSNKLGVDPSQWMRNQGVFMSMANGFGVTRQQAYALSEGLTELSYDISSLFNEDVDTSARRLQSALAGEIEPIRRLGISISEATLQEFAFSHGIEESVSNMTEQEKALIRTMKLLEDSSRIGAIGDFAKTLESPANALRVLHQQITQLGRALGSVLLPFLVQVIPWVQAFVSILTDAIRALATLVGFEMPEWESSSWESDFSGAADAIEDTTSAAGDLKKALLGIDELTILEPNSGGSGGGGGTSDWASALEIPDVWDKGAIAEMETKAQKIKDSIMSVLTPVFDFLKEFKDPILVIGASLAAWKIGSSVLGWFTDLKNGKFAGINKLATGITLMLTGFTLSYDGFKGIVGGEGSILDWVKVGLGTILSSAGAGLFLATLGLPTGWAIGLGVAVGALITVVAYAFASETSLEKARKRYQASEAYAQLEALRQELSEGTEVSKELTINLKTKIKEIDTLDTDFAALEDMVNRAFDLSDIEYKTSDEMSEMIALVEAINLQNLDGIKLEYDSLGRIVGTTRQDVLDLIEAMRTQAQVEGYHDFLVESYKAQAQQEAQLARLQQTRSELVGETEQIFSELASTYGWADTRISFFFEHVIGNSKLTSDSLKAIKAPQEIYDLAVRLEHLKESLGDVDTQINEVTGSLDETRETTNYVLQELAELNHQQLEDMTVDKARQEIKNLQSEMLALKGHAKTAASNSSAELNKLSVSGAIKNVQSLATKLKSDLVTSATQARVNTNRELNLFSTVQAVSRVGELKAAFSALPDAANKAVQESNNFFSGLKSTFEVTLDAKIKGTKLGSLFGYASGGFPETGEIFLSRESGPELVGRIGQKTAVANNDQIVSGIATGVRDANEEVVNALYVVASRIVNQMQQSNSDVYLDGMKVGSKTTEAQNRQNRMYGKSLQNV